MPSNKKSLGKKYDDFNHLIHKRFQSEIKVMCLMKYILFLTHKILQYNFNQQRI